MEHVEPLNAIDRAMRSVDCAIRWMGYPGFETQVLIVVTKRLDATRLQEAINKLAIVEPSITARLEEPFDGRPVWRSAGARPTLAETTLNTNTRQEALDYAAGQLAKSADPVANDPVRFHLIHRPGCGDIFMMQYNHTLMDNRASIGLIRALHRLGREERIAVSTRSSLRSDPLRSYLRRASRAVRRTTADRALNDWWNIVKGGAATLGRPGTASPGAQRFRILDLRLERAETQSLRDRTIAACGFPATSMAILAAVFRALDELAGNRCGDRSWTAGIGIDLNLRRTPGGALHNLMSIIPLCARRSELTHSAELLCRLNDQMRSHLKNGVDLGIVQWIARLARQPHRMSWVAQHCLAHAFSLWYAYFGSLDALPTTFLDVPIEDVFYIGPCWSPIGVTVLAQQFQGRLALQFTFVPDLVSDFDGRHLVEMVESDLRRY